MSDRNQTYALRITNRKSKGRYFHAINNNRVQTAWSLAGACLFLGGENIEKQQQKLAARGYHTEMVPVGEIKTHEVIESAAISALQTRLAEYADAYEDCAEAVSEKVRYIDSLHAAIQNEDLAAALALANEYIQNEIPF
ncbi:hypothetical protein [Shewanella algae]|uniref:hypothetical protein n=1 Tax=Shewanella algae TaxID=38313 RepID=UPI0031F47D01